MGALEIRRRIAAKEISCRELVEEALQKIAATDPGPDGIQAFRHVSAETALARADALDRLPKGDDALPLHGLPIALKDNLCTKGIPTTCGSRILENYIPPYDAHVVECLERAGAVVIGKTNMDEFAMGSSTENSAYEKTKNPRDPARVPGGSSGGSAAAVAAGYVELALGSDTGGSIRQPAAFCGVVGLKPTYGLVSRWGLVAFASSLDQIGPLASDVTGAAMLLDAIAPHDARDATCIPRERPLYTRALGEKPTALRVGLVDAGAREASPTADAVDRAAQALESRGHRIRKIALPHLQYGIPAYYLIAPSEASSNLARFDGVRYGHRTASPADMLDLYMRSRGEHPGGFGPEVKRRILLGTFALSRGYYDAYYLKAQKIRALIRADYEHAFQEVDVILTPTTPEPPFRFGERSSNPLAMYLSDYFTVGANLAGLPAISVPAGSGPLPTGLQITAPSLAETRLLQAARLIEEIGAGAA